MRTKIPVIFVLSLAYGVGGCGSSTDSGTIGGSGGNTASTQETGSGGAGRGGSSVTSTGGNSMGGSSSVVGTGGSPAGGTSGTGGAGGASTTPTTIIATGGSSAVGGTTSIGPTTGGSGAGGSMTGGSPRGGTTATGGSATGGNATGGTRTGGSATGGTTTGGTTPDGGSTVLDCSAAMPTSGGTSHCGSYQTGKAGSLSFELWSNSYNSNACITTYTTPAFSAKWSNNSDYLARVGLEWGGKSIATLGTITADFTVKKSGDSGGYSYIGIYGWATSPCTEYYIIDDSMKAMPFSPWNMTQKGSATIDGEVYKFYSGSSGGTGGSRCSTPFTQNWSVRQKARSCGTITISQHFAEWKKVGMSLDNILEAKVLVEAGGGTGSVEFPVANVKAVAN